MRKLILCDSNLSFDNRKKLSPSWQFKGGKERFKKQKKDEDEFVAVLSLLKAEREGNGVVKDCGGWMDGWKLHPVSGDKELGSLHAIAEAWLSCWLTVSCGRLVAVAIRLLRGHRDAWACCQHQLGCSVDDGLRLCCLLLLFPYRL